MEQIAIERQGTVALVRLSNPPMGYMTGQTVMELSQALDTLEGDDGVRAVVFTGGLDGVFIRHYDVAEIAAVARVMRDGRPAPAAHEVPTHALFNRVEAFPKPTIAAINGLCMGGGFEFALCCDIRLMAEGPYLIGLPEIRVGIFPGAGGTQRLARLIGPGAALGAILRGRVFSPREALDRGLIHELAPGDVAAEALRQAQEIAERPVRAVQAIKRLVRGAADMPLPQALEAEWAAFGDILAHDDQALAELTAFVEQDLRLG